MEATDLEARRQDHKAEQEVKPGGLTRDEAVKLYERLDDAGLRVELGSHEKRRNALDPSTEEIHYHVEIKVSSITSPELLRLIADRAQAGNLKVGGDSISLRLG